MHRSARRLVGASLLTVLLFAGSVPQARAAARAKSTTTLAIGYVTAGLPVEGASIRVYERSGKKVAVDATTSDSNGFFVMEFPERPGVVRVVATGGTLPGGRPLGGSLQALVRSPHLRRPAFLNPVSTVIAAYVEKHRATSTAAATRKIRHLFGLHRFDPIGRELRHRVDYFDGFAFWKRAMHESDLDGYVAKLVRMAERGGTQSFPRARARVAESRSSKHPVAARQVTLAAASAVLGTVASAVSIVSGIGSVVNDIIGWAEGTASATKQILDAVQQMQTQLTQIQAELGNIQSEIQTDFTQLEREVATSTYNEVVEPIQDLAGTVYSTQGYFEDLMTNKQSPHFTTRAATFYVEEISDNMERIESQFNQSNDAFRGALLSGAQSTSSAHYFLGQMLLSDSNGFMTPDDSIKVQNFARYVLYHQALAFHLIARWGTYLNPDIASFTVTEAITQYLGSTDNAREWVDDNPPGTVPSSAPPSGDLHDELAYLEGIDVVPAGTVVDSRTGLMWQSGNAGYINFGAIIPPGTDCGYTIDSGVGGSPTGGNYYECGYLRNGLVAGQNELTAAETDLDISTGVSGWVPATMDQAQAVAANAGWSGVIGWESYYWIPWSYQPQFNFYGVNEDGSLCTGEQERDDECDGDAATIDQYDLTFFSPLSTTVICSIHVGRSQKVDACAGYALLVRTPGSEERYWP